MFTCPASIHPDQDEPNSLLLQTYEEKEGPRRFRDRVNPREYPQILGILILTLIGSTKTQAPNSK